jgi:hypothetical protein
VRVVEVQGVSERAVEEGCARRRVPAAATYGARPRLAAPAVDHLADHPGLLHPARRERYPYYVGYPSSGIPKNTGLDIAVPHPYGEAGDLSQFGHCWTTASGRTGEPVPPTSLSGARTNRNSCTPAAASSERFMTSMMWTPYSTRSSR